jgi:hypothetical protein
LAVIGGQHLSAVHLLPQRPGAFAAEGLHQQRAGIVLAALRQIILGQAQPVILLQNVRGGLRLHSSQLADLLRQTLQLGLAQMTVNRCRRLFAQQHQQHRSLAHSVQV